MFAVAEANDLQADLPLDMPAQPFPEGVILDDVGKEQFGLEQLVAGNIHTYEERGVVPGAIAVFSRNLHVYFDHQDVSAAAINEAGRLVNELLRMSKILRFLPDAIKRVDRLIIDLRANVLATITDGSRDTASLDRTSELHTGNLGVFTATMRRSQEAFHGERLQCLVKLKGLGVVFIRAHDGCTEGVPIGKTIEAGMKAREVQVEEQL